MKEIDIRNSSLKTVGKLIVDDTKIIVYSFNKKGVEIRDTDVLSVVGSKSFNKTVFKKLYDEYFLTVGEIATIFGVKYCAANRWLKISGVSTNKCSGRRNSAYGAIFSESRRRKIGEHSRERIMRTKLWEYPRTEKVRKKTSESVKLAYKKGMLDGAKNARSGWLHGKFDNVDFKRGIGGWFTSKKNNERIFFRSLLELYYMICLEEDDSVVKYSYEPFRISCDNGTTYTPDILINDKYVIELKSRGFVYKQGGTIQEKFEYKVEQAKKYCEENGFIFEVVFDSDIGYMSKDMKHVLRDTNLIKDYSVELANPERVFENLRQHEDNHGQTY